MRGDTIIGEYSKRPWLILPEKAEELVAFVKSGVRVVEPIPSGHKAQTYTGPDGKNRPYRIQHGAALINIRGTILPRSSFMSAYSGLCTAEGLRQQVRMAERDDEVSTILLDIDSPGGYVLGVPEAGKVIKKTKKRVVAAVHEAYSAAYWLASQADEVYVTPSGGVGSIGVLVIHASYAKQFEKEGVEVTIIRSPMRKAETNPYEALTDAAREKMEKDVEAIRMSFESQVAAGRKTNIKVVREKYGQGTTLNADEALEAGMVDGIMSPEEVAEYVYGGKPKTAARMPDDEEKSGMPDDESGDPDEEMAHVQVSDDPPTPTATTEDHPVSTTAPSGSTETPSSVAESTEPDDSQGEDDVPDKTTAAESPASVEHLTSKVTKQGEEITTLKAQLDAEKAKRRNEAAAVLADSLPHLDAKREDLITLLTTEMPEAAAGVLHKVLEAANRQLGEMPSIQQQARNKKGANVRATLDARAKELVKNGEADNMKVARGMVLRADPELGQQLMEATTQPATD